MSTPLLYPTASVVLDAETLPIAEGRVGLDEAWAPYCQSTVSAPFDDPAAVVAIDPRDGMRATISASVGGSWQGTNTGSAYGHGAYGHGPYGGFWPFGFVPAAPRIFDLGIRSRTVDYRSGTCELELASDEALLQDFAPLVDDTSQMSATSLRGVCNYVVGTIIPGHALEPGSVDAVLAPEVPEALTWNAGVTGWDFLEPLLTNAGLRLFCDEARIWRLVGADYSLSSALRISGADATEGTDTISREDPALWAVGVVAEYRWIDDVDGAQTRQDAAGTPGKVLVVKYERPFPGPGAAAHILAGMTSRGRVQDVTVLGNYAASPGMESRITLPGSTLLVGRVASVAFDLVTGLMDVGSKQQTQLPSSAWDAIDPAVRWDDVPGSVTWDNYTPTALTEAS